MSTQPPDIMKLLADAREEVMLQRQWGTGRVELALEAVLQFAELAIQQFDAVTTQVTALEQRIAALEAPPST